MKNDKLPGQDSFNSEFFKFFWSKLKYLILRCLNQSFENGLLPQTLRTCVITCLPKQNKSRELLQNWRLISLLNVKYKIASSVIATRLKTVPSYFWFSVEPFILQDIGHLVIYISPCCIYDLDNDYWPQVALQHPCSNCIPKPYFYIGGSYIN